MLSGVHAEQKYKQKQQKLQEIYFGDHILNVFFHLKKRNQMIFVSKGGKYASNNENFSTSNI